MTKLLKTFYVISTLCLCLVVAREPEKLLLVDRLRYEFLKLEEQLWSMVREATESGNAIADSGEEPDITLIRKFEDFGDIIKKVEHLNRIGIYQVEKRFVPI